MSSKLSFGLIAKGQVVLLLYGELQGLSKAFIFLYWQESQEFAQPFQDWDTNQLQEQQAVLRNYPWLFHLHFLKSDFKVIQFLLNTLIGLIEKVISNVQLHVYFLQWFTSIEGSLPAVLLLLMTFNLPMLLDGVLPFLSELKMFPSYKWS